MRAQLRWQQPKEGNCGAKPAPEILEITEVAFLLAVISRFNFSWATRAPPSQRCGPSARLGCWAGCCCSNRGRAFPRRKRRGSRAAGSRRLWASGRRCCCAAGLGLGGTAQRAGPAGQVGGGRGRAAGWLVLTRPWAGLGRVRAAG
jgi:hypothetical protein